MKKIIITIIVITITTGALFIGCNSSAKKVEHAKENVTEAKQDLSQAQANYTNDVQKFRQETNSKINSNQDRIDELNANMVKEKKEIKAEYKKKIAVLKQKNTDMKKRMDDYNVDEKEKWESFKMEFNHDMDDLEKSLKDLTVKDIK